MFWSRKKKLKVDLGELEDERELLSTFSKSRLKVDVTSSGNKVLVNSEELSIQELKRLVNKFVYHRNLHHKYWVVMEGSVVKIVKFESVKKHEKRKKEAPPAFNN